MVTENGGDLTEDPILRKSADIPQMPVSVKALSAGDIDSAIAKIVATLKDSIELPGFFFFLN